VRALLVDRNHNPVDARQVAGPRSALFLRPVASGGVVRVFELAQRGASDTLIYREANS
jgi:hypothetical protein